MVELPEYIWSDIEDALLEDVQPFLFKPTVQSRADMRRAIEHIIRMVDAIRERNRVENSRHPEKGVLHTSSEETQR